MLLGNLRNVEKPQKESIWCQASHSFSLPATCRNVDPQEVNQHAHFFLPGPGWSENGVFLPSVGTRVVQACGRARRRWASEDTSQSLLKQPLRMHIVDPGPVMFWTSKM